MASKKGWQSSHLHLHSLVVKRLFSIVVLSHVVAGVGACATSARPQVVAIHSAVTSSGAAASQEPSEPTSPPDLSASVYLERALDALRDGQTAFAIAALHAALASGELNDAGRSLAYWYIYVAQSSAGSTQRGHDALADFVAIADSVLVAHDTSQLVDGGGNEFIARFDLRGRLARGRALLSLAWAEHHQHFGRSLEAPVPIQSEEELNYFVELTPACAHPLERKTSSMTSMSSDPKALRRVEFQCSGAPSSTTFFFEWHGKRTFVPSLASHAPNRPARKRRSSPAARQ